MLYAYPEYSSDTARPVLLNLSIADNHVMLSSEAVVEQGTILKKSKTVSKPRRLHESYIATGK